MKHNLIALMTVIAVIVFPTACGTSANNNNNQTNKEMKVIHLTKSEFLTKVADIEKNPQSWTYLGDKPAIIDFYATWCGPCKSLSPILDELAEEYDGKIYVYKIDVDKEEALASAFGIRSVPTLLFVPMNGDPQMSSGAMPKSALTDAIENVLLKK